MDKSPFWDGEIHLNWSDKSMTIKVPFGTLKFADYQDSKWFVMKLMTG
jgi:hypothetical protein